MARKSGKRKRVDDVKDWVCDEIYQMTINSGEFINDLETADEDFVLMFKSIEERQSELYARSIGIQDKYRYIIVFVVRLISMNYF